MARPGLYVHRKFLRLERALGSRPLAAGVLELLWAPAYETGEPYLGNAEDVAARVGWNLDDADALVDALRDAGGPGRSGFIEETSPDQYQIHDLADHAPSYMHRRAVMESERSVTKACVRCHTPFHSPDPKATYCSPACRSAAWRERSKNAETGVELSTGRDAERDAPNAAERSVTNANATPALALAPALALKKQHADPAGPASVGSPALIATTPRPRFDLDALYAAYPRKEGKAKGMAKLRSLVDSDAAYVRHQKAIANLVARIARDGIEPQFVPHFSTWTAGKWLDYADGIPAPVSAKSNGAASPAAPRPVDAPLPRLTRTPAPKHTPDGEAA